jgi:hypothetical protein
MLKTKSLAVGAALAIVAVSSMALQVQEVAGKTLGTGPGNDSVNAHQKTSFALNQAAGDSNFTRAWLGTSKDAAPHKTATAVHFNAMGASLKKVGSRDGAGFSGNLNVTSVPDEPKTGAMLLAGLGLMGLMMRRRSLRD